jgi:UDP-N-acetylmuramoylalanine--D-glutamate ligase
MLVVGLGVTGDAAARALAARGWHVDVVEDSPSPATDGRRAALPSGITVHERPEAATLGALVDGAALVVPSPGVPDAHPVLSHAARAGVPVRSELEVASAWIDRPIVAITGTNGKTTVTAMVTRMLEASGIHAVAAANYGTPLSSLDADGQDVVVCEVSSFQLAHIEHFRPRVAVWLNVDLDHLDVHRDLDAYVDSKARIWENQRDDDLALGWAGDPVVKARLAAAPARRQTFGVDGSDWHVAGGALRDPDGRELLRVDELTRALPHDLTNALAASAAALAAGATGAGVAETLRGFESLPHRLTLVGDAGGVRWYDDSKATNPHAVLAAVAGFQSVVLVAGGRNKGLDLGVLARAVPPVRAVVAIGEAAADVFAAFDGVVPVETATSMDDAVARAARLAAPGDVVLLSPGCASFDAYSGYAARGDDFARAVVSYLGSGSATA